MADTTTTTYGLTKPEVGASEDTWGTKINTNLDAIDDLLDGTTAVTGINITSGTVASSTLSGALPAIDGSALTGLAAFPSGTLMLFQQTAAPTGWTKQVTHNDKALRVVSGTASSGGTTAFSTAFATPSVSGSISGSPDVSGLSVAMSGNIGSTTLSINQIPSHSHSARGMRANADQADGGNRNLNVGKMNGQSGPSSDFYLNTGSAGGGGSHNHSHSLSGSLSGSANAGNLAVSSATAAINVQYVDLIIAAKD